MWRSLLIITLLGTWINPSASQADHVPASQKMTLEEKASHLFNRLAFGARPGEIEKIVSQGPVRGQQAIDRWIAEQMNPSSIPDANLDERLAPFKSLALTPNQLIEQYPAPQDYAKKLGIDPKDFNSNEELKKNIREKIGEDHLPERIVDELDSSKIIRAVESRRQLEEVLTDFWFNHFNVDLSKGETKWYVTAYEREVIRKNIFGNFRTLLGAVAESPAMMFYLDNHLSVTENPNAQGKRPDPNRGLNENYGRELLELHTLGVDAGYTQNDVREVARAFTGWSIDDVKKNAVFKFKEKLHDVMPKKILGHDFPANQQKEDGDQVLNLLVTEPATAHFIALKLCRYFVADQPPPSLVDRTARMFLQSKGDLKKVYLTIFKSPEFWSKKYYRAKIKTPFQYLVSSARALGGEIELKSEFPKVLNQMGQPLFRCSPPTGYKDSAESWVNPGALVARLNFGLTLAANRVNGVFVLLPHFEQSPRTPKLLVSGLERKILHGKMSSASEDVVLKEFANEGRSMADGEVRPLSLAKASGLILGSPEFQRR